MRHRILRGARPGGTRGLVGVVALLASLAWFGPVHASTRYVDGADPTCGQRTPCHATIQAAVTAALPGDTVVVRRGTYIEQVAIAGKNSAALDEAARIVIQADPAAPPGVVVLRGAVRQCTRGHAIEIRQSRFVTIRGLVITGAGGPAISLLGGNNDNHAIHIERNRIVGNGTPACTGGIAIGRGNPDTVIANNLIHGNGRNGVAMTDADGGPHLLVGNTIHANGWHGVSVGRNHHVLIVNNAITGNGTDTASVGSFVGLSREPSPTPNPGGIQLLGNVICGNRSGEIAGPVLDPTDAGNRTPTGGEGPGVIAVARCRDLRTVYAGAAGPDGLANTLDDDFAPAPGSPLVDAGVDPRALGLAAWLAPVFEADFLGQAVRPRAGASGAAAVFDAGAIEAMASDAIPPVVSFVQPSGGTFVRGTVTVAATAADAGAVASLVLRVDGAPLNAAVSPQLPASAATATAAWPTTAVPDGAHTLTAEATDASGLTSSAQRAVIVDNTSPVATIIDGPAADIGLPTARFAFAASDNVSAAAALQFAWRLDGGPFTPYSPEPLAVMDGLTAGSHTFEVKARDQAGNESAPAQRAFTVTTLRVDIAEPAAGAEVAAGPVLVRGAVSGAGPEVGVTVNGVPAFVHGDRWAAVVTAEEGASPIRIVVTTADGRTAAETVTVTGLGGASAADVFLAVSPGRGPAPLDVQFSAVTVAGTGDGGSGSVAGPTLRLDADGDGTDEFTGAALDGVAFRYAQPGLYVPVLAIDDPQAGTRMTKAVVHVLDAAALDALLRAKWSALKDALRAGDVSAALQLIHSRARPRYQRLLQLLAPRLAAIDAVLTSIVVDEIGAAEVFYKMARDDDGVPLVFEVRFALDDDGIWRLRSF